LQSYTKLFHRARIILLGGINRIAVPINNVVVSYLIISYTSANFWGSIVYVIILLDFAFSIISWGNRPYLIREFSLNPKNIPKDWRESFAHRLILLLLFWGVLLILPYSWEIKLLLIVWSVARYLYQSFEAVIQYQRNFSFSVFNELVGLIIIVIPILVVGKEIEFETVILLYSLSISVRAIVNLIFYNKFLHTVINSTNQSSVINTGSFLSRSKLFLIDSFPFLLLTFSAMLRQRTDLFCVAYFLEKGEVAQYQIFLSFLGFSQLAASLLLSPFAKNIFRLPKKSLRKLERSFMGAGVIITLVLIIAIYLIMTQLYGFEFSRNLYILGYVYAVSSYLFLIKNFELGKARKQRYVAYYALAAGLINLTFSVVLTPYFKLEGALSAGIGAQIFLIIMYNWHRIKPGKSVLP